MRKTIVTNLISIRLKKVAALFVVFCLIGTTVANLLPNISEEIVTWKYELEQEEGENENDTNDLDLELDDAYLNPKNGSLLTNTLFKASANENQVEYLSHIRLVSPPPRL